MKKFLWLTAFLSLSTWAQEIDKVFPGADEKSPSRSQYFSWINNTNEGATESQTLVNLAFFKWMKDTYGLQLDIYAFDAGALDGKGFYGSMLSERFRHQFPGGFRPIADTAAAMGTRLGIWGGPDGFGTAPAEEQERIETMVSLCRDYHFELFKMDAVCGQLRPEKYDAFERMMTACRKYSPNLILLNHRLNLGQGTRHSTTFLLGGAETYIDVHMANTIAAPHHRAGALARELPPGLTRLTEDHGVCLSSCLNYWEDDLVLQAFNRSLILAPELYGNPWLLKDDEFPQLSHLFNIHRKYSTILVSGTVLPENEYGLNAVSRGDSSIRLITLRNLSWEPATFYIKLNTTIGLKKCASVQLKSFHPTERIIGRFAYGSSVPVVIQPFRSCLLKVNDINTDPETGIEGIDYQVISDLPGKPITIRLLGFPSTRHTIKLNGDYFAYQSARIDGVEMNALLKGKSIQIHFPGEPYKNAFHRKIGDMTPCPVPTDAASLYEGTCYAADNNALEVRELKRSGESRIPQVTAARKAFFEQKTFIERETWDHYLFDNDPATAFSVNLRWSAWHPEKQALRIDLGRPMQLDSLIMLIPDEFSLQPLKSEEGEYIQVSSDLLNWKDIMYQAGTRMKIDLSGAGTIRYVKFFPAPIRITEVAGFSDGHALDRSAWRASNLFRPYVEDHWNSSMIWKARKAWSLEFTPGEIPEGSYLCVAIHGEHGNEGAVAGVKIDGQYLGFPDRAPSFKSNTWELSVREVSRNYTYYFPLKKEMKGRKIEIFLLGLNPLMGELHPEVYISAYPAPCLYKTLIIE